MKLCERCEVRPGSAHRCNGDGGDHYHGEVHIYPKGRKWLCDQCWSLDRDVWNKVRVGAGV